MMFERIIRQRRTLVAFAALCLAVGGTALAQQAPSFVSIGTASASGAYYPLGVAMADLWNRGIQGVHFGAQETGGGIANINMLAGGEIELGIANENIAWDAARANEPFTSKIDVHGGWIMNNSYGVFVVSAASPYRTVADLKGKKVALGAPGSSANVIGAAVLESAGLKTSDYSPVYMGWQESADAIADGFIDAAVMVGGQPFPAIESLAVRKSVRLLTFDADALDTIDGFPLTATPTPAQLYGTTEQGTNIVIHSNVYVIPTLPEDLVYDMVKIVFDNIPVLKAAHPSGDEAALFSEEQAERLGLTIHPGVIRYAKEVGAW